MCIHIQCTLYMHVMVLCTSHQVLELLLFFVSKGSVLGPEEFLQGLGIGLKSFLGGTVGEHV